MLFRSVSQSRYKTCNMIVHNLSENNSVLNSFLEQIRSVEIQKDRLKFRRNIERIGEVMAYEISKSLSYSSKNVVTPLGIAPVHTFDNEIVLGTIFRAGLPFHQGLLSYFDMAENAFISAYRKYKDALKFEVFIEYIASPSITGKTLIVTDPMLATGSSMELAYEISKDFAYSEKNIPTPLGIAPMSTPDNQVVISTILRAGLPFHHGFLSYLDNAENAFVSGYR